MNKLLRYFVIGGVFLIPFIPLIVANSFFFPFITGKNFAFRIIVELIFGAWIILAVTNRTYRPRKTWIMGALGAFVLIMALADIFGMYPYKSFWSNYERMEGFITLIHLAAYTVVAGTVLNTKKLWAWFWNTSIGVSTIMCLYGFAQLAGWATINQGGVRLDARLGNATYLAVYVLFHIFLIAYLMLSREMFLFTPDNPKPRRNIIIMGSILILFHTIILYHTATRGALLGLIGGIVIASLLIIILGKNTFLSKKIAIGILVAAVIVVGGFVAIRKTQFVSNSPVLSRFASISLSDNTTKSRFVLWNMAFQGFKERPLLGWGQENFNYVFNKHYNPVLYNQEQWFDRTHNVIFDWLIAGGILGLLAYLSLYVSVLWSLWKHTQVFTIEEKSVLTGLLCGYFIHNLFVFDNITSYILFFSVVAYVYYRTKPTIETSHAPRENKIIAPVALVLTLTVLYVVNVKPIQASMTLIDALIASQSNNVPETLKNFKKVIGYNTFGSPEAREQLFSLLRITQTTSVSQVPAAGAQELIELIAYATEQGKVQIARTPNDVRYYLLLGSYLIRIGNAADALSYLKQAQTLSPNKQSIIFETAAAYANVNDFKNSTLEFKHAFELEPSNEQARILYAASMLYTGDAIRFKTIIGPLSTTTIINSDYILQAYYDTKQYLKVIEIWKARVAETPNDIQKRIALTSAYLLNKNTQQAISEIEKIIILDPSFKTQGEEYIKQIKAGKLQ